MIEMKVNAYEKWIWQLVNYLNLMLDLLSLLAMECMLFKNNVLECQSGTGLIEQKKWELFVIMMSWVK